MCARSCGARATVFSTSITPAVVIFRKQILMISQTHVCALALCINSAQRFLVERRYLRPKWCCKRVCPDLLFSKHLCVWGLIYSLFLSFRPAYTSLFLWLYILWLVRTNIIYTYFTSVFTWLQATLLCINWTLCVLLNCTSGQLRICPNRNRHHHHIIIILVYLQFQYIYNQYMIYNISHVVWGWSVFNGYKDGIYRRLVSSRLTTIYLL